MHVNSIQYTVVRAGWQPSNLRHFFRLAADVKLAKRARREGCWHWACLDWTDAITLYLYIDIIIYFKIHNLTL